MFLVDWWYSALASLGMYQLDVIVCSFESSAAEDLYFTSDGIQTVFYVSAVFNVVLFVSH